MLDIYSRLLSMFKCFFILSSYLTEKPLCPSYKNSYFEVQGLPQINTVCLNYEDQL
jgi:hypothetical protein